MLKEFIKPFQYKRIEMDLNGGGKQKTKAKNWTTTVRRIWSYLAFKKGLLTIVFVLILLSSLFGLLGPFLIGWTIDNFIVEGNYQGLTWILLAILAIYLFNSCFIWLQNYWMIGIAQNTVNTMRNDLFNYLHQLPLHFFQKNQHGQLMSRITNDIENVSRTLNTSIISILTSVLTLSGMVIVMLWLSPLLTVITLTIVPLMFFGMKWITKRTSRLFREQQQNLGTINGYIEETISGQRVIKAFSQEKRVISEFNEKNVKLKTSGFWAQTYSGFIPKLMNLLNSLSFTIIAAIGGILALNNIISIGVIVIFAEYARQFTRPLNDLANQFNTVLAAIAGAERVFEILDEEEEINDKSAIELTKVKGSVEFNNVSFAYDETVQTIQNVSFQVNPGETVALVGPTGAGKTTLINLLSRFYDTNSGEIYIDGHEIKQINRESLRNQMGFVLQDSFLFQGTIKENIRYGKLDADDEEIIEAAKLANAHSFIMKLPNKYETVLLQEGSGISQGQKQLLSIARAVLRNPSILVLDEATSSIDTVTEVKIQEALQRLMNGRTSFVIAHRLNTIQMADQILVLQNGHIIEQGSQEALLEKRGMYFDLHSNQIQKKFSVEGI